MRSSSARKNKACAVRNHPVIICQPRIYAEVGLFAADGIYETHYADVPNRGQCMEAIRDSQQPAKNHMVPETLSLHPYSPSALIQPG